MAFSLQCGVTLSLRDMKTVIEEGRSRIKIQEAYLELHISYLDNSVFTPLSFQLNSAIS